MFAVFYVLWIHYITKGNYFIIYVIFFRGNYTLNVDGSKQLLTNIWQKQHYFKVIIFIFRKTDPVIVDQILNRVKNERISHKSLTFSYVKTKTSEDAIEICYWQIVLFVPEMFSLYQEMCQMIFDTLRFTMTRSKSYKLMK